jgi:hypothetical protein
MTSGVIRTKEDTLAVAHIIDLRRLRVAIRAGRRNGHLAGTFEDGENLLPQTRVHHHLHGTGWDATHFPLNRDKRRQTCLLGLDPNQAGAPSSLIGVDPSRRG